MIRPVLRPFSDISTYEHIKKIKVNVKHPITGLECPRGFQEVQVPRFNENGPGWW
jgi:hypothetical protein